MIPLIKNGRLQIFKILPLILLLFTTQLMAQKVGLVLSGGGSKGVAHIGVIRALEEAEVPIDYIAGTSMGAIIGGLYAAGYSPDEMELLVTSPEFYYWLSGKLDDKYTYFFKKSTPDASWIDFKFRVDSVVTPSLPSNIVSPVLMDFAFMKIFAGATATANRNFDSLMVPFRCVASDIARTEPVVLSTGDLGTSIRASMTFPFYFKPIRIDGKLLFDGGMYNNFPSDVMLNDFFPDIIIGSQAAANYAGPVEDNVISQLQNMLMLKSQYSVICDNGVLIKPNLKKVNVIDFSNTAEFIDSGYVATMRQIPEIREFVVDRVTKKQIDEKRAAFNQSKPPLLVGNFHVSGLKSGQFEYVNRVLRKNAFNAAKSGRQAVPSMLSLGMIEPEYFKLLSEGKIDDIYPQLEFNRLSGLYDLYLNIKSHNQALASVGGAVTSTAVNELFLQVQYDRWNKNSLQLKANAYFGRFYNSGMLSARLDFPTLTPFFIKAEFIYNKFNFFKTNTYFFEDEDPFFLVESDNFGCLSVGLPFTNNGVFAFRLQTGDNRDDYYQTNLYTRADTLDRSRFEFTSPGFLMELNTLNRKEYASSGSRFSFEAGMVYGTETFKAGSTLPDLSDENHRHAWFQSHLEYENYFARLAGFKTGFYGQVHFSTQNYFSNYTASILAASAFQPVSESRIRFMPQFRANRYIAAGSKNIYSLTKNLDLRLEFYAFMPTRAIRQNMLNREAVAADGIRVWPMATSTLVYFSPVGPLSVSLNYFNDEANPWSFFLKFGYLIFNKRPF